MASTRRKPCCTRSITGTAYIDMGYFDIAMIILAIMLSTTMPGLLWMSPHRHRPMNGLTRALSPLGRPMKSFGRSQSSTCASTILKLPWFVWNLAIQDMGLRCHQITIVLWLWAIPSRRMYPFSALIYAFIAFLALLWYRVYGYSPRARL